MTAEPERLAFSLELLANAGAQERPLRGCDNGHLVVGHNNHFQAEAFAFDLRTLTCRRVDDCDG